MTPPSSRKPKRPPATVAYLEALAPQFDLADPRDAAVFACLTTVFWSVSRLGEFTVREGEVFDPAVHIKVSDVSSSFEGRLGLPVTTFRIPRTKMGARGESAQWTRQEGVSDPSAALEAHLALNCPGEGDHLFAWRSKSKGLIPLQHKTFLRRVNAAAAKAGLVALQGHSLRIGGVLEYLLRGIPFDVVKVLGRWSSDAFSLYLREHVAILAPYIQDSPILEPFTRIAMPRQIR